MRTVDIYYAKEEGGPEERATYFIKGRDIGMAFRRLFAECVDFRPVVLRFEVFN